MSHNELKKIEWEIDIICTIEEMREILMYLQDNDIKLRMVGLEYVP